MALEGLIEGKCVKLAPCVVNDARHVGGRSPQCNAWKIPGIALSITARDSDGSEMSLRD